MYRLASDLNICIDGDKALTQFPISGTILIHCNPNTMLKKIYRPHIVYNAQKIYRPLIILKHVLTCMCTFPSSRMSDRISLTWSEFQKFVAASFANARSSSDFSDVTLVGGDYQLEAHRLVLSAGSRFFSRSVQKSQA